MGFKTDTNFLRFLTMGANGVRRTMASLKSQGFSPIELERYSGSNKMWSTKVKRLRLPDVLCIKTGLRIEVRAKSVLSIKMSDSPSNPERAWDVGLRDDDLVAFVVCPGEDCSLTACEPQYFSVADMRRAVMTSRLGAPKSASEGAERDREWPTTVPKRAGEVIEVTDQKIVVRQFASCGKPERKQSYQLRGKVPYVQLGDSFGAGTSFLAGTPSNLANTHDFLGQRYDTFAGLKSPNPVDRYSAAKSFPHRNDDRELVINSLEGLVTLETDQRVKLEAAGSALYFDSSLGQDTIAEFVWGDDTSQELRMEAMLVLVELGAGEFTRNTLESVAGDERFSGNEVRQVAVWGLGKAGLRDYEAVLPYITDDEENVALHAMAAFDENASVKTIDTLVSLLLSCDAKLAPAASETLRIINSPACVYGLAHAYDQNPQSRNWIIATLGRMSPPLVREQLANHGILTQLEPIFLYAQDAHWLSSDKMKTDISFLLEQNL